MSLLAAYPSLGLGPLALDRKREAAAGRSTTATTAAAAHATQVRTAVLLGSLDPHVRSLLSDVLREINVDVEFLGPDTAAADVALVLVERADGLSAIGQVRARFAHTPVVAILPLGTHRLATRAVAAGAQACYLLDMPIDRLRGLIIALLREREERPKPTLRRGAAK